MLASQFWSLFQVAPPLSLFQVTALLPDPVAWLKDADKSRWSLSHLRFEFIVGSSTRFIEIFDYFHAVNAELKFLLLYTLPLGLLWNFVKSFSFFLFYWGKLKFSKESQAWHWLLDSSCCIAYCFVYQNPEGKWFFANKSIVSCASKFFIVNVNNYFTQHYFA